MRAISLFLAIFAAFSVPADPVYKDGKFNCLFMHIKAPKFERTVTIESTKDKPAHFDFDGVTFIARVAIDNLVTVGARFADIRGKPYAESYGKNSAWVTVLYDADRTGGVAVTGKCDLIPEGT